MTTLSNFSIESKPIVSLHKFCQEAGITPVTAWRWRRKGWLVTINKARQVDAVLVCAAKRREGS